jgi:hypothetical protein
MSLVGVFTKFRPEIGGIFFDATLDETSTLMTIVSSYPLEDASTANDNAVTKPLELTMTVAISDNPIKAMTAGEDNLSGLTSMGVVSWAEQLYRCCQVARRPWVVLLRRQA